MSHINCGSCRFFSPEPEAGEDGAGFCRRYPPAALTDDDAIFAVFPPVSSKEDVWCGEYSPKAAH